MQKPVVTEIDKNVENIHGGSVSGPLPATLPGSAMQEFVDFSGEWPMMTPTHADF